MTDSLLASFDDLSADDADPPSLPAYRHDGWTPFARRLFLEVLSETGRVSRACEYCALSTQSAYALRHRDPVFAAGWDAACELARAPLADALYERAIDGVTETITRDGEVVAERHRHDSRLSIAVLHRLDKRCDAARAAGSNHLALAGRWDEWTRLVGEGDDTALADRLREAESVSAANAPHHQLHQLRDRETPATPAPYKPEEPDPWDSVSLEDGVWWTSFPPPPDYADWPGRQEIGAWGDYEYSRRCTPAEANLLQQCEDSDASVDQAEAAAQRDLFFANLADALAAPDQEEPDLETLFRKAMRIAHATAGLEEPASRSSTSRRPAEPRRLPRGREKVKGPRTASSPILRQAWISASRIPLPQAFPLQVLRRSEGRPRTDASLAQITQAVIRARFQSIGNHCGSPGPCPGRLYR